MKRARLICHKRQMLEPRRPAAGSETKMQVFNEFLLFCFDHSATVTLLLLLLLGFIVTATLAPWPMHPCLNQCPVAQDTANRPSQPMCQVWCQQPVTGDCLQVHQYSGRVVL